MKPPLDHFNFQGLFFQGLKNTQQFGVEIHPPAGLIFINKFLFFCKKQCVESTLLELTCQDFMEILIQKIWNGITTSWYLGIKSEFLCLFSELTHTVRPKGESLGVLMNPYLSWNQLFKWDIRFCLTFIQLFLCRERGW